MIDTVDTDEYEGYTIHRRDKLGTYAGTDIYVWSHFASELPSWTSKADFRLLEDAPKLLREVKRLRERLDLAERYIIEPTLIRNYFADLVSKGLYDERDNLG